MILSFNVQMYVFTVSFTWLQGTEETSESYSET